MSTAAKNFLIILVVVVAAYVAVQKLSRRPVQVIPRPEMDRGRVTDYLAEPPVTPGPVDWMRFGEQAPDFIYPTVHGYTVQLSDYIGEKPVVLYFWGTWSTLCEDQLPEMQEFYSRHSEELEIIAITCEDAGSRSTVLGRVGRYRLRFLVMHDPTDTISRMYPETDVTSLVLIGRDGNVIKTLAGFNDQTAREILASFGLS